MLESERILLRNLQEIDLEHFFAYRSLQVTAKYQNREPLKNKEEAFDYIKKYLYSTPGIPGEWALLGIINKKEDILIGDCSIKMHIAEPRNGEIGCTLSPDYQGKGYAKEAISLIFDYAFKKMNMHRIIGIADARNKASLKLMKSLKMREEGYFIKNIFFKGSWGDEYLYAILEEEWLR